MGLLHWTHGVIDDLNRRVGTTVAWLTLGMVLTQFTVVVARYVFAKGSIPAQESIWYMHGLVFMVGAGYTLLRDGHVRVDLFYRPSRPSTKAIIDLVGVLIFLVPVCVFTVDMAWDYVVNSWRVKEKSTETNGIPAIYLLKSSIILAVGLLSLQALSMAVKSAVTLVGENAALARNMLVGVTVAMVVAANRALYEAPVELQLAGTVAALVAAASQIFAGTRGTVRIASFHAAVMILAGIVLYYCGMQSAEWARLALQVLAVWCWILAVVGPGVALATAAGPDVRIAPPAPEAPNEMEEAAPPAFVGRDLVVGVGLFLIVIEGLTAIMLGTFMDPWLMPVRIGIIAVLYLATLFRMNRARLALVAALFLAAGETLHYASLASGDVGAMATVVLAYGNIVAALLLICSAAITTYAVGRVTDFQAVIAAPLRAITAVAVSAVVMALIVVELMGFEGTEAGLLPPPLRTFVVLALPVGLYVGSRVASWLSVAALTAAAAFLVGELVAPGAESVGAIPLVVAIAALALCIAGALRCVTHAGHTRPGPLPQAGGPDHTAHVPALAIMGVVTAFLAGLVFFEYVFVPWHVTGLVTPVLLAVVGASLLFGAYQGRWLPTWLLQALLLVGGYFSLTLIGRLGVEPLGDELRFYVDAIFWPGEDAGAEARPVPSEAFVWLWVAAIGFVLSAVAFVLPPVARFQAAQREARRGGASTTASVANA